VKPQPTLQWLRELTEVALDEVNALALNFSQLGCASSRLVGGKGCQLALLAQLNSSVRPPGALLLVILGYCKSSSQCTKSLMSLNVTHNELN